MYVLHIIVCVQSMSIAASRLEIFPDLFEMFRGHAPACEGPLGSWARAFERDGMDLSSAQSPRVDA